MKINIIKTPKLLQLIKIIVGRVRLRYAFWVALTLLSFNGMAQQFYLTGRIHKEGGIEVLVSVSVHNLTRQKYNLSDQGGNFKIQAIDGDVMVFSSAGYLSDTLVVTTTMLGGPNDIGMEPRIVPLPAVEVGGLSNYQLDSLERRQDYAWVYDRGAAPLVDKQRQGDGVGVNLNLPFNSSEDRERKKLKKRLIQEEQQYYIDSRFTREYVVKLTKLEGDSLQHYMVQYRPSYAFCRTATNQDILLWINDSFKKYKKEN
jgi:hypothetical protein